MKNPVLENNLSNLPPHLKDVLPQIREGNPLSQTVETVLGERGWPVAVMRRDDAVIHTNSLVDPWEEGKQWAQTLDYKDVMVSFIYGCGFGYPLIEYYRRKKPYTETIIFEENTHLFYAMLTRIDMTPLLKDPSVHFVIGTSNQMKAMLNSVITSEFLLRATKPAAFFTWLAHRNEKATYLALHEWLWNTLELHLSSVGNSVHDTLVGMYNTLDNVNAILHSPKLDSLKNSFAGKPAFIVSNGPSLDKNIELLHEAVGKSLIFTAESALQPCLRRGIVPDAICVTERTPNVYHIHFEHQEIPPQLVMVGLTLMDPRIPASFKGPWVPVFRNSESTGKWIQNAISENPSGEAPKPGHEPSGLHGGGSSAHLAFEFALWVGANPIVLIGQDLAFGPNKQTHSKLSAYTQADLENQVKLLQSQPSFTVKGVDGQPVLTTKIWYEFKTWFEQKIQEYSSVDFIDATEGGAYIQGTRLMTLREALDNYCTDPLPMNLYQYLENVTQDKQAVAADSQIEERTTTLVKQVVDIKAKFSNLVEQADSDIHNCNLIERACKLQEKYPESSLPPFVEKLFQTNTAAFKKYAVDEQIVPFTQQVIFAIHKQINDVGEVDSVQRLKQVTGLQKQMFQYLQRTCHFVKNHFELAEQHLKQTFSKS
ncbi:motility associated factor glycosyltransferase family protein [Alicyclobacillus sp. SO9]|uniref:motility associated factor glycosyltransferase family protein n=1 Tax=Alicyclobacillus sp. SO9 TaxID=2665646 RepID=UPI0018E6E52F|nr:6-hydroxymethylpterin diphosphokinase MptE-like protein [Alicyclobacillus sp. SO9]QQE78253.1 motility associated factor glycosyltransferase family protein [Alicyclobacillus sp. SO9]